MTKYFKFVRSRSHLILHDGDAQHAKQLLRLRTEELWEAARTSISSASTRRADDTIKVRFSTVSGDKFLCFLA